MNIFIYTACINVFALSILCIVYNSIKLKKHMLDNLEYRLFLQLIMSTTLVIIFDMFIGYFNGKTFYESRLLNNIFSCLYFIMNIYPCFFWFIYIFHRCYPNIKFSIKTIIPLCIPLVIHASLSILSLWFNIFYTISATNYYTRGIYIWISYLLCYGYVIFSVMLIFLCRKKLYRKDLFAFLLFTLIPLLSSIVQMIFEGLSIMWPAFALGILMVQINVYNDLITTDQLTGLFNRRQLMANLKYLASQKSDNTVCIMLDLDYFKRINDEFGHVVGDKVIADFAKILKNSLPKKSQIYRYGGDEFIAILNLKNKEEITDIISNIEFETNEYNEISGNGFSLQFSSGYEFYDSKKFVDGYAFLTCIDDKMYEEKESHHKKI